MRALIVVLCLAVSVIKAVADPLSSADREALLENLEKLRGTVTDRVDARFRAAIVAYRGAMASEGAALDFYLKCESKVNFEDKHRKPAEFRDWKKREEDRLSDPALRRALIHQLRWLVFTLQAASEKADFNKLLPEGQQIIDDLFNDVPTLTTQQRILGENVIGTVFAKAYEITGVKLEKWPYSPLNIGQVYDAVLLPQYRASGDIQALRSGWLKRIRQEGVMHEEGRARTKGNGPANGKGGGNGGGGAHVTPDSGVHSPGFERFIAETLPDLQWQMESDLFRSGDQRGAALRMIEHIKNHLSHAKAREWSDELKALLTPPPPVVHSTAAPTVPATTTTTSDLPSDPYANP